MLRLLAHWEWGHVLGIFFCLGSSIWSWHYSALPLPRSSASQLCRFVVFNPICINEYVGLLRLITLPMHCVTWRYLQKSSFFKVILIREVFKKTPLFPGLTWQDDITQQVISRELSKLRNVPLRHQAAPPSLSSSRDRKLRPAQAELNRNLQQYLTGLGFLPHSEVDGQPGVQRGEGSNQVRVLYTLDLWQYIFPKCQTIPLNITAHCGLLLLFYCSVLGPALTFRIGPNPKNVTTADLVQVAGKSKSFFLYHLLQNDPRGSLTQIPVVKETRVESGQFLLLSVLCMLFILVALAVSTTFFCVRQRSHLRMKEKLASLGTDTSTDATATYQELCRQRMAIRTSERVERPETLRHSRLNSVSSQFSDGPAASPSTRSSTSSWCEEPVPSNMDISTGHMILSYMEDHLKNKNRLEREWEALCSYQAEPSACSVGQGEQNSKRNRSDAVVVYDHSRITLKAENNHGNSDYINASPIMDHDPRNPTYISSQGPLPSTVADFWQMVWESGCVVIVMLTPLSENGVKQCHHYWPDEGSDVYHIYEVNLVSEHIWCEDFLVRSFYLKNLQTNETRTVTQFHFLSWMDRGIPNSARTLLDFRRKVNKCYRGRSCPIIVHCSDGAGRSGTYILIDMVLNRMAKGAKEIDIAATLEHLRDQRAGMVQTKEQFEFALTAVAEEVNAILKALPQ
uniref:Protein tyrosine phosphatase receptor type N2 n=1 Tax=Dicentrarchus labrax TaxID=13489 RepID=A0A8P4G1K7_DICLA